MTNMLNRWCVGAALAVAGASVLTPVARACVIGPTVELQRVCGDCGPAPASPAHSVITASAALAGDAVVAAAEVQVVIQSFAFGPASLTVPAGTAVRWTNFDSIDHSVRSQTGPGTLVNSGVFDSPLLDVGESFVFTFETAGRYDYFCVPHGSSMQGVIHVTPVPEPTTTGWLAAALASAFARRQKPARCPARGRP